MRTARFAALLPVLVTGAAWAQPLQSNIPYARDGHPRHVLDIHHAAPPGSNKPVCFWIHGGGWQTGDKTRVQSKPEWFATQGFVFVAINHRFLPEVDMETLTRDVTTALGWVHENIHQHGGDPGRILVAGHSSGAQLAALLCCDPRHAAAAGIPPEHLAGCIPVDGDTYDVPAIVETAETRRRVHHQPQPAFGHREKFGHTPENHALFSAVTHVRPGLKLPPFLILHVASHPDNSAQAHRLASCLRDAGIQASLFAAKETDHIKINASIGTQGDPATAAIETFLQKLWKP